MNHVNWVNINVLFIKTLLSLRVLNLLIWFTMFVGSTSYHFFSWPPILSIILSLWMIIFMSHEFISSKITLMSLLFDKNFYLICFDFKKFSDWQYSWVHFKNNVPPLIFFIKHLTITLLNENELIESKHLPSSFDVINTLLIEMRVLHYLLSLMSFSLSLIFLVYFFPHLWREKPRFIIIFILI